MLTSRVIVYSDLNCPFCYALNEWLEAEGKADRVRWRGVEHMPELVPGSAMTEELRAHLAAEVIAVQGRDPDLAIALPPLRPNSRLAIATLLCVEDLFPEKVAALRTAVFRALWHEGLDISNEQVIARLLKSAGIDAGSLPSPYFSTASECFDEWDRANYRRIPVLRAPTGATYLGLGDAKSLSLFMGSALFDVSGTGTCAPPGKR